MKTFLVALLFFASTAGAQQPVALDTLATNRLLDSARVLGLPTQQLRGIVQNGKQRGVGSARVLAAMREQISALDRAKRALGKRATDTEIDAGAGVLLSGAPVSTLVALRAAKPTGDITVSLVVLADLVVRGVPLSRAEDALVTLTRFGATDDALHEFRQGVQRDLDAGQGAESSLLKRTRETVSRFRPGGPPPSGAHLDQATVVSSTAGLPPQTVTRALASVIDANAGTLAEVRGSLVPLAQMPGLRLRATADGNVDAQSGHARIGGELLALFGSTHPRFGGAFGFGVTAASEGLHRAPIPYAESWFKWRDGGVRLEARAARLASDGATPFQDASPLTATALRLAYASAPDTGETNPPPQTFPPPAGIDSSNGPALDSDARSISDFRFEVNQRVGRVSFEGATGLRILGSKPLDSWAAINLATWVHPSMAIVSGWSGRRAISGDAAPMPSNVILGVRWRPAPINRATALPSSLVDERAEGSVVRLGTTVEFVVRNAAAHRVEVSGDFTEWMPVDMTRLDGKRWRIALPADRPLVRLRVRFDGGAWVVPYGVPKVRDAFGEELGTVLVARTAAQ